MNTRFLSLLYFGIVWTFATNAMDQDQTSSPLQIRMFVEEIEEEGNITVPEDRMGELCGKIANQLPQPPKYSEHLYTPEELLAIRKEQIEKLVKNMDNE